MDDGGEDGFALSDDLIFDPQSEIDRLMAHTASSTIELLVFVPCSVWTSKVVESFISAQSPFRISRPLGTHCRCSSYHGASDQPSPASCLTTTDLCCSACAHDTLSTCYAPMRCTRWPCAWFRASLQTLEKTPSPHLRYGSCASGSVRALGRATRRLIGFLATRTSDTVIVLNRDLLLTLEKPTLPAPRHVTLISVCSVEF